MSNQIRGKFITVEGTEGVGKSTNVAFIKQWLAEQGIEVIHTREPGGTPFAEEIRELLLSRRDEVVDSRTELLLMYAARCQHVAQKIEPVLAKGQWVLCDRFSDASFAYQGFGRGLGFERLEALNNWSLQGFKPDLTLLFDLPVEIGLERALARSEADRFEEEKVVFFEKVREGYLTLAKNDPERMKVINVEGTIEQVQVELASCLQEFVAQDKQGSH